MTELLKEKLEEAKKGFFAFFIQRRAIAWLIMFAAVIAGTSSLSSLPREIQPEVEIPFAAVTTVLPGANPVDVETLISIPLEDKIANISDIKTLSSTSGFGFSSVFIEFEAGLDMDDKLQEVKDAVDLVKPELPEDATDPIAAKAEANAFSIVTFSLMGEQPIYEMTEVAEKIQDEFERLKDVKAVALTGTQKKYIEVKVDQAKSEGYGLSIDQISNLIKLNNNNLPVGIVESDKINYSIRIDNRFDSIESLQNMPLVTIGQEEKYEILLKDIASVQERYPTLGVISRLSANGEKSEPAISLQVYNKDDSNVIAVVDETKAVIEAMEKDGRIPHSMSVHISNDNSQWIKEDLGNLTRSGIQTMFIIMFILFLALGLRQGIIAGLSIPLIFMITFIVLDIQGMTINSLSLFSLVIALGLMVDTTIVIMEGIYENIVKRGLTSTEAALLSVETYKWPLIAGTLTTVFAFFPMLLVSGILGEFLKTLPITISAALLSSLFIALTVAPSISTKFIKAEKKNVSILHPLFERIGAKFHDIIENIIQKRKYRVIVLLIALTAFASSLMLPITGLLKVEMFPSTDQNYFIVQLETQKGTSIDETNRLIAEVEAELYNVPEVQNFLTKVGTSSAVALSSDDDGFFQGGSSQTNLANITVNLIPKEEREVKSYIVAEDFRKKIAHLRGADIRVEEITEGPPSDGAITIRVSGEDFDRLTELSNELKETIATIPQTKNVRLSISPGLNEFKFTLDEDILSYYGLRSLQVSALIRNIIQGIDATDITIEGEDLGVLVSYDLPEKNGRPNISIHDIENFEIPLPAGGSITLGEIGTYEFGPSPSSIVREDQKRRLQILSDIDVNANVVDVTAAIEAKLATLEIPKGYEYKFGGDFADIEESFKDLFRSMFVAVVLIAFTLVMVFNSFRQPVIILLTLPLALIGVFPGLMLVGLNLSFPAFLGVVALTGIVVNDAIVLIDRINSNRKEGMPLTTSIAEAANARLQPIIMTSITTIAGILPLALTNEFWAGLGYTLIFGLTFSTILTLIVIPVLYFLLEGGLKKDIVQA